jgi:hypothetical protein
MEKIKVRWEVEDGYVGKSRPRTTTIDIEQLMDIEEWEAMPEDKKREFIEEIVQKDFEQKISFGISDYGLDT